MVTRTPKRNSRTRQLLRLIFSALFFCSVNSTAEGANEQKLIVHEWGTFTSLQDEQGVTIGGINSDDEPVPYFVHDLARMLIIGAPVQGAPKSHPHVTMRLETPVIYFYLPKNTKGPRKLDVEVEFKGGWLTQFYPKAEADAPGLKEGKFAFGALRSDTVGRLLWKNLELSHPGHKQLKSLKELRAPNSKVWSSPRAVKNAATVTNESGQSERFLFYRGVGHIEAPLRVKQQFEKNEVSLMDNLRNTMPVKNNMRLNHLWYVEVNDERGTAYKKLSSLKLGSKKGDVIRKFSSKFDADDFSKANQSKLRSEMKSVLIGDGLYADEAEAMLNTWELSYFKSFGRRIFFLVPQEWTDHFLPLKVSEPASVVRVVMGRLELVTPEHRKGLARIRGFKTDEKDHATWKALGNLGRFRNALILDEQLKRPSKAINNFINKYPRLKGYEVPN